MKPLSLFFAGSLVANAALLVTLAFKPALAPPTFRDFFQGLGVSSAGKSSAGAKSRGAARAYVAPKPDEKPLWTTLQAADLRGLVANLRAAGFSPALIRAIVGAQIDLQFRARMKELAGTVTDTPFWKPETPGTSSSKVWETYNQIYRERGKMMREVLGDDFLASAGGDVTAAQRRQFGDISKSKVDLIQQINEDYQEMTTQVRNATQGITLPEDREKIALLEKEKRADLAAILSPKELEDYLMRTSPLVSRLRMPLSIMDATEAEFRAIYQIQEPNLEMLYPGISGSLPPNFTSDMMNQRRDAQKQVNDQIVAMLGEARGAEFVRASNSEFQNLYRIAQRESVPMEATVRAFNLRDATAQQSMAIMNDRSTNNDQKRAALQNLAQTTKAELIGALGVNAGTAYTKAATWLNQIESGRGVTFMPDGGTSYRSLPPAGATPPRG